MDVDEDDFARVVRETSARARGHLGDFDHPLELDRRIESVLASVEANSHALSIESHPNETAKNKAGQFARRLALNPAEQRRLNREIVSLVRDLDQRSRRHDAEIAQLKLQLDRLLALRSPDETP